MTDKTEDTESTCFICQTNVENKKISPNGLAVAVPFRNPIFPGHQVVAPLAHRDLEDVLDEEWIGLGRLTRSISAEARKADPAIEKCYVVAIGDVDRGHLHFHVIPKRKDDPSLGPHVFGKDGWMGSR